MRAISDAPSVQKVDATGDVDSKLQHIVRCTRRGALPFILLLDANQSIADTEELLKMYRIEAEVLKPRGGNTPAT